jgi:hypothetical protein
MLDFLAHAVLLNSFWTQNNQALKTQDELFRLIPFGYLSFLLLTILFGGVYVQLFRSKGNAKKGLAFGAAGGGLFALSNFFGWYSFLNLPTLFLLLASLVYFVEISAVGLVFGYLLHPATIKKRIWIVSSTIVSGFILGIAFQNIVF